MSKLNQKTWFQDLTGQVFSRLTVIRLFQTRPVFWLCQCECGKQKPIKPGSLKSGNTRSCGCLLLEHIDSKLRKRPFEALYLLFLRHRTKNPKTKQPHVTDIIYEDFLYFTGVPECYYCGAPVSWTKYFTHKNGYNYNLDRKNNNIGYTKDNVVVCCYRCNRGKNHLFSYEEWVEIGKTLRRLREKKEEVQQ